MQFTIKSGNKKTFSILLVIFTGLFFFCENIFAENKPVFELIRFKLTDECDTDFIKVPYSKIKVPEDLLLIFNRNYYDWESFEFVSVMDKYFHNEMSILQLSGYYIPENDSVLWMEDFIVSYQEEKIALEIENMDKETEEENSEINEEIEKAVSDAVPEAIRRTKDKTLSDMNYTDEIFMPTRIGENFVTISSTDKETIREFYDKNYRITKKEYWKISTVADSSIKRIEEFEYSEDNFKPIKKSVTENSTKEVQSFDNSGNVTQKIKYFLYKVENEEKETDPEYKIFIVEDRNWKYDSKNQVIEDKKTIYSYSEDYSKLEDTFEQKHVFVYNRDENIPADEEYYEDNVLKLKTKYSKVAGTYITNVYFDNNFTVRTYFENNVRVKEVFISNGEVLRVRNYEKK